MGRAFSTVLTNLKLQARILKQELQTLVLVARHPQIGWRSRLFIVLALAYALSPIDFIPDFIPILGYLDDLIIVPLLIRLALQFIPKPILEECRRQAQESPPTLKKNWITAIVFGLLWLLILTGLLLVLF